MKDIFDWFKNNKLDIVLSVSNRKNPIAFCVSKTGERYTTSGSTVEEALSELKILVEDQSSSSKDSSW